MNTTNHISITPDVDVVMIAYNKERYIGEAIAGVVRQAGDFRLRLIIMDDCSTDATPEIIRYWQKRYPNVIHYVRNERNLGLQANYIAGFRLVTAKYMAICDADDYWCCHTKLKRQIRYMENHPECAITFHRVINYYESSGEMSLSHGRQPSDCDIKLLSRCNFITNLSVVYRRDLVDLQSLPNWILNDRSPDYIMHMLYASQGYIHFFRRPMGVYRKTEGSSWSMTEQFERLKMSLIARKNLIIHFGKSHEATIGLKESARSLLLAMARCADSTQRKVFVREQAAAIGIDIPTVSFTDKIQPTVKRKLTTRLRAALSKFIPRPRP